MEHLKKLIDTHGLDQKKLAKDLFPGVKYPNLALSRVLSGAGVLDADQVSKLAAMLGLDIDQLFTGGWRATTRPGGIHVLESGSYRAELDTENWKSRVFVDGTLAHETVLLDRNITLKSYIKIISQTVKTIKHESN